MGISRRIDYVEPQYGEGGRHATVRAEVGTRDDGGTPTAVLAGSAGVAGQASARQSIDDALIDVINGRRTSFGAGKVGAFLTAMSAATDTTLDVDDDTGFADGDAVAIFNSSTAGVPESPEYRLISGPPAGNVITLGSGLSAAKYVGARIVRLAAYDVSVGVEGRSGIKSQLQAPTAVDISVADGGSQEIDVTITPNNEDEATHYDIYVRETRFRKIEPGWIPDGENITAATVAGGAVTVTTFEGGANTVPDGGGGSLLASTYYVAAIAKNGSGRRDVDESRMSNVEEITLA